MTAFFESPLYGAALIVFGAIYLWLGIRQGADQMRRFREGDYHAIVGFGALGVAASYVLAPCVIAFGAYLLIDAAGLS